MLKTFVITSFRILGLEHEPWVPLFFNKTSTAGNIRRSVIYGKTKSIWRGSLRPFVESKILLNDFASAPKRSPVDRNSSFALQYVAGAKNISKGVLGANGVSLPFRGQCGRDCIVRFQASVTHVENRGLMLTSPYFARSFASRTSKHSKDASEIKENISTTEAYFMPSYLKPRISHTELSSLPLWQTRKELSNVEDPFDAPTYNIPEKPVTFTEGAGYSLIILVGLGIPAAAGYAVFKELIFQPREYKIFNQALERIQNESQVRVRIGHPITGYGQETRNRAARQRIPNRIYTDENGIEHVEVTLVFTSLLGKKSLFV
ncbi:hypothetical protein GQ457_15G023630 [Hibiscus cannabinus]